MTLFRTLAALALLIAGSALARAQVPSSNNYAIGNGSVPSSVQMWFDSTLPGPRPASTQYPLPVASEQGLFSALDVTAATVIKATPGRLARVMVLVAGTTTGTVNDATTTAAAAIANEVYVIPNAVGVYMIDWPFASGIVVVPGTGQTLAISYS